MKLVVTVDTEEDNWARYSATDNPVRNIDRVVPLQQIFDRYGVRPTYLVTYPVATDPGSSAILERILHAGRCEIGMHCHPWNTPPLDAAAAIRTEDTMLCNLPEASVFEKLSTLHAAIERRFGVTPVSFRAGRWGFGPHVARALCRLGYRVDSSVTPYVSWADCHGPDYSTCTPALTRLGCPGPGGEGGQRALLEVPATVGFLQSNFSLCGKAARLLARNPMRKTRISGLLWRLGLLNRVWLTPELSSGREMVRLAAHVRRNGYPVLNFTFHSNSLQAGFNPITPDGEAEARFVRRIEAFLAFAKDSGWTSHTLGELAAHQLTA